MRIRIKEPDSPGSIIPLIPIIPQINTKNRLSFSLAGVIKLNDSAIPVPIIKLIIVAVFHCVILFPTKYIDAIINPKKNAQIKIGYSENRYLNKYGRNLTRLSLRNPL